MKTVYATILSCLLCAPLLAGDISGIVKSGEIWEQTRDDLARGAFNGVRFATVDDNTIRVPRKGGIALGKMEFGETLVTWAPENGATENLVIMVYNRGDDGDTQREEYMEILENTISDLNEFIGTKGKPLKVAKKDSGVSLRSWKWEWDNGVIRLDASYTGGKRDFKGEFIRMKLGADQESVTGGGAANAAKRKDLKENVQRDEDGGDVWISVPMVDQGQKGYCVPASVSRVFAYYGMDGVDQHALAQLCSSSADGGTSVVAMQEALESIARKFHIRIQMLEGKDMTSVIMNFIADYNKAAKKLKKPQASPMNWVEVCRDPKVLLAARGNKKYTKKWFAPIKKSIDVGVPVLWSVELGLYPEEGAGQQSDGAHMRMIVGYNEEKGIIYFSDSWGAGHEKKAIKMNHAAAMTQARYILRPSR
ncbi:MAG: hypothetical protein IJ943_06835 [Akkermansia sp.]|nr:hypothetical protein [Akkermansia sp.]